MKKTTQIAVCRMVITTHCRAGACSRRRKMEHFSDFPKENNRIVPAARHFASHPMIMDLLMQKMKEAEGDVAFAEVPLLFEGNFEKLFHKVVFVRRNKTERILAVENRDGLQIEHIKKRIEAQFDGESAEGQQRLNDCNAHILDNNGTPQDLKEKILDFLDDL